MNKPYLLKFKNLYLTTGFLYIVLISYLSLIPEPVRVVGFGHADKIGHFSAYLLMMFWFVQIYSTKDLLDFLAVAFILTGVFIEYLQLLTGFRSFEYADMLANAAGVFTGRLLADTRAATVLISFEKRFCKP